MLLTSFLLGCLISAGQLAASSNHTPTTPIAGGIYREGILGNSLRDIEVVGDSLTKVGLLKIGLDGLLTGNLADSWTTSEDGQTIRLHIKDKISADTIVSTLHDQTESGYWKEAEITTPESQIVQFQLSKPWAGFAAELVTPIFPYGPFTETDSNDTTLSYNRNSDALETPYLDQIELQLFTDSKSLERAARKNTIDGAFSTEEAELMLPASWHTLTPNLAQEYVLFFNTRQDTIQDVAIRQKLARNERLNAPLALRLAIPENSIMSFMASDLANRWQDLNVQLTIQEYPLLTLTKNIIPERNYDLILLGIDYGPDKDLYPYWHSSQIAAPGNNLAGYRNKQVDQILDETRKISDQATRQARYGDVRKILSDEAVFISLGSPKATVAFSTRLKGNIPAELPTSSSRFTDVNSWYMKERHVAAK